MSDPGVPENKPYLGSPDNPKTAGVVCYITLLGWLIAYFALYKNSKNEVSAFHLRQTLLLHIFALLLNTFGFLYLWDMFPYALLIILGGTLFIMWLSGLWGAVRGKKSPAILVGYIAQRIFSSI